ncbi:MAG: hypothetical protein IKO19_02295 [Candidatus Riflebacteria bacterium]|nr:hypothetical protein [Candidatus Riflebacteria bacterium]
MKNTKKTPNKKTKQQKETVSVPIQEELDQQEEIQQDDDLEIRAMKADFAVQIEEVMAKECSSYECVLCDEHEIGVLWSFLLEDSISGFIGVEDNEDSLGIQTVTTGIHLKDISEMDRNELMHILELNSELINACFTVVHIQEKSEEEEEPVFAEEGESIEYDNDEEEENINTKEILLIQCKIPLSAYDPSDFSGIIQNLMIQSDFALNQNQEEEL